MDAKVINPQKRINLAMQIAETLCRQSRELRAASNLLNMRNTVLMDHANDLARRYASLCANLMDKTALSDL